MFQLTAVTEVICTNVNLRPELHGEERVLGCDIAIQWTGANDFLDVIEDGLVDRYYYNASLKAGQRDLTGTAGKPNLRFPKLENEGQTWAKGERFRHFRFIRDYGAQGAILDWTDVVVTGIKFDCKEGGSVTYYATLQYNGEELQDAAVRAQLSMLSVDRNIHVQLLAPPAPLGHAQAAAEGPEPARAARGPRGRPGRRWRR
jgi:hypothetical protein